MRLVTSSEPAYCTEKRWVVTYDGTDIPRVRFVKKVERPWKEGETESGIAPCLLYVAGEPFPWYVASGYERVSVLVLPPVAMDF
jgi:hypothetical protein